ncbi:hypothetical protein U1Q18_009780 [Sarracenia purpurea var. burkii]
MLPDLGGEAKVESEGNSHLGPVKGDSASDVTDGYKKVEVDTVLESKVCSFTSLPFARSESTEVGTIKANKGYGSTVEDDADSEGESVKEDSERSVDVAENSPNSEEYLGQSNWANDLGGVDQGRFQLSKRLGF